MTQEDSIRRVYQTVDNTRPPTPKQEAVARFISQRLAAYTQTDEIMGPLQPDETRDDREERIANYLSPTGLDMEPRVRGITISSSHD